MNKMECKIAGISFSVTDYPELAMARPQGMVEIKHEPFKHPKTDKLNDDLALRVYWDGTPIGYIKKEGEERVSIWEYKNAVGEFPKAEIKDYSYKPAGTNDFNRDHNGILASVLIECEMDPDEAKNFEFYEKGPRKYKRASNVMDFIDADGSHGIDGGLTRWMINTFATHSEYATFMRDIAAAGTDKHDAVEMACKAGVIDAVTKAGIEEAVKSMDDDVFARVPEGFWNFVAEHCGDLECVGTEETVYDEEIGVAGTYDAEFSGGVKTIVVDWKSSKKVTEEHIIKTCFYAFLKDADEAWVVALGSKNKCGYQVVKVGRKAIEAGYKILKHASFAQDFADEMRAAIKGSL